MQKLDDRKTNRKPAPPKIDARKTNRKTAPVQKLDALVSYQSYFVFVCHSPFLSFRQWSLKPDVISYSAAVDSEARREQLQRRSGF